MSLRADDYQPDERIAWFVPDACDEGLAALSGE